MSTADGVLDAPALGDLGATLQKNARITRLINDILARANAAAISNPTTLGDLAAGDRPVVTQSSTEPDLNVHSRLPSSGGSTPSFYDPYRKTVGGWLYGSSNIIYAASVTKNLATAPGGASDVAYQTVVRHYFLMDGDRISFALAGATATPWRLMVDGQYYDRTGFTPGGTGARYWTLDFTASTTPRKLRLICVELQPNANADFNGMGRFYVRKSDTVWAPSAEMIGPHLVVVGDSFAASANATAAGDGFARYMGDQLGLKAVTNSGFSGSGFIRGGNSDAGPNLLERLADIAYQAPSALLIADGFNDMANDGVTLRAGLCNITAFQAQVSAVLSGLRTALPDVPIVIVGPWRSGSSTVRGKSATWAAAVQAAVTALADPMISYQDLGDRIFTGLGNVSTPYSGVLTFTGALSAATSGTLASPFAGPTSTAYTIQFSDGSVKTGVTLTNGSTSVSWTGAVTATAAAYYTHASAGNADVYVSGGSDNTHPNDNGHKLLLAPLLGRAFKDGLQAIRTALLAQGAH
jgi:lysophospholipase L1-like esterase